MLAIFGKATSGSTDGPIVSGGTAGQPWIEIKWLFGSKMHRWVLTLDEADLLVKEVQRARKRGRRR